MAAEAEDDDNDLDLEAGYQTETLSPPKTEAKVETKPQTEQETKPQATEQAKPEAEKPKAEAKPETEAPKYRQITEEEWNSLSAAATKTASLEKQISTALGTIGNVKQLVTKLQNETPKGAQIELPKAFLKKLRAEHPEIAALIEEDLTEAFKGIKGTGGDEPKPSQTISEDELNKRLKASRQKDAEEALEDEFPKWREIVGGVDSEGKHDPNQPFRGWLAQQSAEYQELINSTDNPYLIARAIRRFRKETAKPENPSSKSFDPRQRVDTKPSPKKEARTARISSAVTPKSAGGSTQSRNSADDDFEAGYASERGG